MHHPTTQQHKFTGFQIEQDKGNLARQHVWSKWRWWGYNDIYSLMAFRRPARVNKSQYSSLRFQFHIFLQTSKFFHFKCVMFFMVTVWTLSVDEHRATVAALEVGLVLLHLHHEVMEVNELWADCQAAERGLVQDLVEPVVVLDQLG